MPRKEQHMNERIIAEFDCKGIKCELWLSKKYDSDFPDGNAIKAIWYVKIILGNETVDLLLNIHQYSFDEDEKVKFHPIKISNYLHRIDLFIHNYIKQRHST